MKNNKNTFFKTIKYVIVVCIFLISTATVIAQTPPLPPFNGPPPPPSDSIPLDGGLATLVIAAAVFGVKKLR